MFNSLTLLVDLWQNKTNGAVRPLTEVGAREADHLGWEGKGEEGMGMGTGQSPVVYVGVSETRPGHGLVAQ